MSFSTIYLDTKDTSLIAQSKLLARNFGYNWPDTLNYFPNSWVKIDVLSGIVSVVGSVQTSKYNLTSTDISLLVANLPRTGKSPTSSPDPYDGILILL